MRHDGRPADALRPLAFTPGYLAYPDGSVLIAMGQTRVICAATLQEDVPPFLKGTGQGWLTAEYAMLPAATEKRSPREAAKGKIGGRTHEIQRLIGRSLRAVTALDRLGERTIQIDCDVIQADGGTRTASITGAFVALGLLEAKLRHNGALTQGLLTDSVAAVSVGRLAGVSVLDLDYREDSRADVDMNVVMTGSGRFVEVQGTAEGTPFDREALDAMLALAAKGIGELTARQRAVLEPSC